MSTDNATKTDLLSLQDRLNKLDAMADNPWGYKAVEWDEAYTDAQYEARACKGMALGVQAADIAKRFKRSGKRFHACAAFDLVPRATLEHAQAQLRAAGAMNIAIEARIAAMASDSVLVGASEANRWTGEELWGALRNTHKNEYSPWGGISDTTTEIMERLAVILNERPVSIGPGDPLPPPPPPTKGVAPWTGEELYCTAKTAATAQAGVWSSQNDYQQKLWDAAARVVNKRMGIKTT